MPFNLNQVPKEKPSSFTEVDLEDGLHEATIEKVEYTTSTNGNQMLKLRFKSVPEGKFIFDQIMDDQTNQLNLYKLSKLLEALNITPTGTVELKDMTKFIRVGAKLIVATVTKPSPKGDKFVNVDVNKFDGYYSLNKANGVPPLEKHEAADEVIKSTPQPELKAADDDESY